MGEFGSYDQQVEGWPGGRRPWSCGGGCKGGGGGRVHRRGGRVRRAWAGARPAVEPGRRASRPDAPGQRRPGAVRGLPRRDGRGVGRHQRALLGERSDRRPQAGRGRLRDQAVRAGGADGPSGGSNSPPPGEGWLEARLGGRHRRPQRGTGDAWRPPARPHGDRVPDPCGVDAQERAARHLRSACGGGLGGHDRAGIQLAGGAHLEDPAEARAGRGVEVDTHGPRSRLQVQSGIRRECTEMKARSVVAAVLLGGALLAASGGAVSANMVWCLEDPPILVVTPGGHNLTVNNMVYLPPYAVHLKGDITDAPTPAPPATTHTPSTVHVHVPTSAHVVSTEYRYQVSAQNDGSSVITLYLDAPTT